VKNFLRILSLKNDCINIAKTPAVIITIRRVIDKRKGDKLKNNCSSGWEPVLKLKIIRMTRSSIKKPNRILHHFKFSDSLLAIGND